jgi:UDP-3-O-[3-hydroxymyristoyl] glucosamine N-acyltransferase
MEEKARLSPTLAEIVARLGGELVGDPKVAISGVGAIDSAQPGDITFVAANRYGSRLTSTRAAAVVLSAAHREATSLPRIVTDNPYLYFARIAQLFHPAAPPVPGVHGTALVAASAQVHSSACIGPYAYVGEGATIGSAALIGYGCHVGDNSHVGAATRLVANVTIYPGCRLGERVLVHAGVVVGADGFGIAWSGERWEKIPQIGGVTIGDDVEIGANSTIDRGALEDTIIEEGVKLDNQIQVGHNVRIGAHTAIAGCVGIAGSAKIGQFCRIGGAAGILGHLEICDHVTVSAFTLVTKSITRPGTYTGGLPHMRHEEWLEKAAQFRRLDDIVARLQKLEKKFTDREKRN